MTPCSPIPEDDTLHNHRCENLESYTIADPLNKFVSYLKSPVADSCGHGNEHSGYMINM
jgi:hypothetical protein